MSELSFDAVVIGGGPAGGMTAGNIAGAGFKVAVVEEHPAVGEPVQCAGLVSPRCLDIANVPVAALNKLTGADIFSPAGNALSIGSESVKAVVIDRTAFDRAIMDRATDSGATLFAGKRALGISRNGRWNIDLGGLMLDAKLLIGADGPNSATRRMLGLGEPTFRLSGFQADVAGLDMDPRRVRIFTGKDVAPNFFAWMIPAGDVTRIGLCVRDCAGTAHVHFKKLFKAGASAGFLKGGKIVKSYAGTIPLGTLPRTHADGAMLVGDAAAQVKATSGGGIYPGLVCAVRCAETAVDALGRDDLSEKSLATYQDAWRRDIGDELDKALMIYRVYSSLEDRKLEDIFGMLGKPEMLDAINGIGDIDYPSRLGWVLLRREPGLLKYAGKFLRHGILNW